MSMHRSYPPLALYLLPTPASSSLRAEIRPDISAGPPPIPFYDQPLCPGEGAIWTPGFWAWGDSGYFWVPGTWVTGPEAGLLWTPGYWGWSRSACVFHTGFWGATVGFYGGVNLGFGYGGSGFEGGRWQGPDFHYNRSLTHLGGLTTLKSYDQPVLAGTPSRVSYNGGPGGAKALATPRERAALWEHHLPPTAEQDRHLERASGHPGLLASVNRGNPPIAATERPGDFSPERSTPGKGPGGPVEEETLAANPRNLGRAIPGAVRPPEVMEEGFQLDGTRDGA